MFAANSCYCVYVIEEQDSGEMMELSEDRSKMSISISRTLTVRSVLYVAVNYVIDDQLMVKQKSLTVHCKQSTVTFDRSTVKKQLQTRK